MAGMPAASLHRWRLPSPRVCLVVNSRADSISSPSGAGPERRRSLARHAPGATGKPLELSPVRQTFRHALASSSTFRLAETDTSTSRRARRNSSASGDPETSGQEASTPRRLERRPSPERRLTLQIVTVRPSMIFPEQKEGGIHRCLRNGSSTPHTSAARCLPPALSAGSPARGPSSSSPSPLCSSRATTRGT